MSLWMVFDVESVGLHGEGFAVGYVVIDQAGKEIAADRLACNPGMATERTIADRVWVNENVPSMEYNLDTPGGVRDAFWAAWRYWAERGAALVADCAWPVEARFLAACVDDNRDDRTWEGPYPLHDVATALLMADVDPLATGNRLPNELPVHDPLADARQSARLWLEVLR